MGVAEDLFRPFDFISQDLVVRLRRVAREAETLSDLHADQWNFLFESGWLKMLVAREFGGSELSLPEVLRLEEALAWVDGSLGWVVTLASGAGWFSGFMEPAVARAIYNDPGCCVAGSGAPLGIARQSDDGFIVRGKWPYASGALRATAFTASCLLTDVKGDPIVNSSGEQIVRPFVFFRDEVQTHKTWKAMGMVATGSHAFEVASLLVPGDRSFDIEAPPRIDRPLFRYSFDALAITTLAVNLAGMSLRCVDLASETSRYAPGVRDVIEASVTELQEARSGFYKTAEASWQRCQKGDGLNDKDLIDITRSSLSLSGKARDVVNRVIPLCGMTAADSGGELNRVWRNFFTAAQHSVFRGFVDDI
jgi:alkylation response protein AidB-like acyl-CoA dehydrogenase